MAPKPIAITSIIAIINSGIALKKIVIILAIWKTKKFGAKFLAENNPIGMDKTIAKNVPKIAISIVSNIANINLFKLEKSGGNILPKISTKYPESGSGCHPLTDNAINNQLKQYEKQVKDRFDQIVPVLKSISNILDYIFC